MKNLIKASILILIIIGLPILADVISNLITMDTIMKCVYFTSGLVLIGFRKVGR